MSPLVVALALSAALAHASWNAFLRSGADRLWVVTVMSLTMLPVAIPFAVLLPLPGSEAWPYLFLSAALQAGYSLSLVAAYRVGDLGQVYPVIRGTVPVFVAVGGYVLAGENLAVVTVLGIGLIVAGIMTLALGSRKAFVPMLWAIGTGVLIALYVTVDAVGVRAAGDPVAYTAWICIFYGPMLVVVFLAMRGRLVVDPSSSETWKAVGGGLVALLAYGLVVTALSLGPAGPVAALRETSVIFAALIGAVFLGEPMTRKRVAACLLVACGAMLVG